jgi:hypothetical protein
LLVPTPNHRLTVTVVLQVQDEDGDTPLHNAARGGHARVVRYLLAEGAGEGGGAAGCAGGRLGRAVSRLGSVHGCVSKVGGCISRPEHLTRPFRV